MTKPAHLLLTFQKYWGPGTTAWIKRTLHIYLCMNILTVWLNVYLSYKDLKLSFLPYSTILRRIICHEMAPNSQKYDPGYDPTSVVANTLLAKQK